MVNKPLINGDGKLSINHPVIVIAILWMLIQGLGTVFTFVKDVNSHPASNKDMYDGMIVPKDVLAAVEESRRIGTAERGQMMRLQERQLDVLIRIETKLDALEKRK